VEDRRLWIDIRAAKETERLAILVEAKGFENMSSPVEYLAQATGKYTLYRAALDYSRLLCRFTWRCLMRPIVVFYVKRSASKP
jgi:hypothetical protein